MISEISSEQLLWIVVHKREMNRNWRVTELYVYGGAVCCMVTEPPPGFLTRPTDPPGIILLRIAGEERNCMGIICFQIRSS